jgi:hypothetical protein
MAHKTSVLSNTIHLGPDSYARFRLTGSGVDTSGPGWPTAQAGKEITVHFSGFNAPSERQFKIEKLDQSATGNLRSLRTVHANSGNFKITFNDPGTYRIRPVGAGHQGMKQIEVSGNASGSGVSISKEFDQTPVRDPENIPSVRDDFGENPADRPNEGIDVVSLPGVVPADNDEGAALAPALRREGVTVGDVGGEVNVDGKTVQVGEIEESDEVARVTSGSDVGDVVPTDAQAAGPDDEIAGSGGGSESGVIGAVGVVILVILGAAAALLGGGD